MATQLYGNLAGVELFLRGDAVPDNPQDAESLRSAMTVQGYSMAFDHVLDLVRQKAPLNGSTNLDLHKDWCHTSSYGNRLTPPC